MRHKQHFLKKVLSFFLLAFSTFSCSENVFDVVNTKEDFNHLSAKLFFESNISELKIPDMFVSGIETRTDNFQSNEYRVEWDMFIYSEIIFMNLI